MYSAFICIWDLIFLSTKMIQLSVLSMLSVVWIAIFDESCKKIDEFLLIIAKKRSKNLIILGVF